MSRRRARSFFVAAAALSASLIGFGSASPVAAASASAKKTVPINAATPRGFARLHNASHASTDPLHPSETRVCNGCTPPLVNSGGPVMGTSAHAGENTQYSIYWTGAGTFRSTFEDTVDQYLKDVAADSGASTNVYSVNTEYSSIVYSSHFGGRLDAPDPLPANGCAVDTGYTACVSDAQMQQEITNVITAQNLTGAANLGHMFLLFLPPGVESCDNTNACSGSTFCGYHGNFNLSSGGTVIWSDMPYLNTQGCTSGQQPNAAADAGSSDADNEIDTLSHEVNESITDPLGTGWADSSGNENGDECSNLYGTPLGTATDTTNGTQYNQVINGHHYYTQEEFSNAAFANNGAGCIQHAQATGAGGQVGNSVAVTASPARIPNDGTSTSTVTATVHASAGGGAVGGDEVDFTTYAPDGQCGTVAPAKVTTTASGVATTTYTSSKANDELCTVIASETGTGQAGQTSIVQGGETYHALAPFRLADTRASAGTYAVNGPALQPNGTVAVPVRGVDNVPADATAAVLNITATDGSAGSYFTAYGDPPRPTASNLNFVAGQTVANLATVPINSTGAVNIYNLAGTADLIVDLEGYMEPGAGPLGLYHPVVPARVTDTRTDSGYPNAGTTPGANGVVSVHVSGTGGVPGAGVSAVVLNVTAVTPTASGYLTAYPDMTTRPVASNINFAPGQVVPNRVIVPVPADGVVDIYNLAGHTDVVVDVGGWFTDSTAGGTGTLFTPLTPTRVADTRANSGKRLEGQTLGGADTRTVPVAVPLGLPSNAQAVAGNITVVNTTAASFLTVFPAGQDKPTASDLNWVPGQVVPNQVVTQLGGGNLAVYNNGGTTDVIVDISGFWS